ncbi:hypothetical protein [Bremerella sp.]|uniref:hypothetical protein n=1 Tax=Bremerella sp. TaxID=2795602 RepID=UPI00391A9C7D
MLASFRTDIVVLLRWSISISLMGAAWGCSHAPGVDDINRCLNENPPHSLAVADREITNLAIEETGNNQWRVTFDCRENTLAPWVVPASVEPEIAAIEARIEAANVRKTGLRQPEIKRLEPTERRVKEFVFPQSLVVISGDDSKVVWNCEGIYTQHDSGGKLALSKMAREDGTSFRDISELSLKVPSPRIIDGSPDDPLVQYSKLVDKFEAEIVRLETTMQQRLTEEQRQLEAFIKTNRYFTAEFEGASTWVYSESTSQVDTVSGVLVDPQDMFSRCVLNGELRLASEGNHDANGKIHDGWVISFENADSKLSRFAGKFREPMTVFYDMEQSGLRLSYRNRLMTLQVAEHTIPFARIDADTFRLGTKFEGIELVPGKASQRFTATVTQWKPSENFARLIAEVPDDPHNFNVFEGVFNFSPPHHLGLPIQLKHIAGGMKANARKGGTEMFANSPREPLCLFIGNKEKPFGKIGTAEIQLTPIQDSESTIESAENRWKTALKPGTIWMGTSKWRNEASQGLNLVIAENRSDGQYVRMLLEKKTDPTQFVVMDGAVQTGANADAYGFLGLQKGVATHNDTGEYYGVIFSRWEDNRPKSMRLTPDGKSLHLITTSGEWATFSRSDNRLPVDSLTTSSFTESWKKALQVGKAWNGTIVNSLQNQKAEVILNVTTFERLGDEVQLEIRLKGTRSEGATYRGSLDRSDEAINGFALTVKKVQGGAGASTLLGSRWPNSQIQFRLAPDGKSLVGRAISYGDFEYLILKE